MDWSTDSMCQFFRITLSKFGKNVLYVIVKGIRVFADVYFYYFSLTHSYQVSQLF